MRNQYIVKGDTVTILLQEKDGIQLQTVVDLSDLDRLLSFDVRWYASFDKRNNSYYAISKLYTPVRRTLSLHRIVVDAPAGRVVDHMDHDTLDNRKSNLRLATVSENMQNRKGAQSNSKSGIRGVHWCRRRQLWLVNVVLQKKNIRIGEFDNLIDAGKAAEEARSKLLPFSQEAINQ